MKPPLLGASSIALDTIKIMDGVVKTLQINKKKMQQAASTSYAISLDIAEQLVTRHKLPFRGAHKIVGALVDKAASMGNMPLGNLGVSDIASILKAITSDVQADELVKIIKEMTPEQSLELRKSSGSPNSAEQEEMIQSISRGVSNYRVGIGRRTNMVEGSFDNLAKTVEKYLQS
jgi:argininosuccinate lyase